jgi:phage terminase large subunit
VTTAPTKHQVVNLLWRRLRAAYRGAKVKLQGRCLTAMLEVDTEWYAIGIATDEEVNFQGPHSAAGVLMVGDEASGLAEWIYPAMQGTLTQEGAKQLLIGNPNHAAGFFYESHRNWPAAQRFHISAFDVPAHILTPGWKEEMLADHGEASPVYQVKVLGKFPPQGTNALISLQWVEDAMNRDLPEGEPCEIGVDIAYYGDDESVAVVRKGNRVVDLVGWRGHDTVESAGQVAALAQRYQPSLIKVDGIGYGAGTLDTLQHAGWNAIGVNVGEAAWDSDKYHLRRTEAFFGLAERFKAGEISLPDDPMLTAQLTALTFSYTPRGQLKLISKEEMKKERVGNNRWTSPDRADAVMLAMYTPLGGSQPVALIGAPRPSGGFQWATEGSIRDRVNQG